MRSLLLAVLCCGCAVQPAPALGAGKVKIGRIAWYTDYDAALKKAQRVHKPVWLHFGEHPG